MKSKLLCSTLIFVASLKGLAQIGVSYHDSAPSFLGINYTIKNRLMSEVRVGTDVFNEDIGMELVATYILNKNNENYHIYLGLGAHSGIHGDGVAIPVGINIYPFENKSFGFQTEVAPIFGENPWLRGSWGIRYRF